MSRLQSIRPPAVDQADPRFPDSVVTGEEVLLQRLMAIAPHLLNDSDDELPSPNIALGDLFARLFESIHSNPQRDRMWLLLVALTGSLPVEDELRSALRTLERSDPLGAELLLLEDALQAGRTAGTPAWNLDIVTDVPIVDVDFSARHGLHTGIQRVVRSTVPKWDHLHEVVPVAWTHGHGAFRHLDPVERERVLSWHDRRPATTHTNAGPRSLVVPWRTTVVLTEVPSRPACPRLAALAAWSGNRVVGIGYDCIPIVSGLLVPPAEPNKFVDYLTVVKHMTSISAISSSATVEFRGFSRMLEGQGLSGPRVEECALPVDRSYRFDPTNPEPDRLPQVLVVGSFEPRKNQHAILYAAQVLWREGLRFHLRFIGGGGWGNDFPREIRRLRRSGRDVTQLTAVTEADLEREYRSARFTVFVSLHEGYGLPVAESIAYGTPALVTDYGSVREIGSGGGALFVDPRNDDALVGQLRRLLVDDELVTSLRKEIEGRAQRSWTDYAEELWTSFQITAQKASVADA